MQLTVEGQNDAEDLVKILSKYYYVNATRVRHDMMASISKWVVNIEEPEYIENLVLADSLERED